MATLLKDNLNVGRSNESTRHAWVHQALAAIPAGWRILDAGAGEQRYREQCRHLRYVSQDFAKYDGQGDGAGLQTQSWDQSGLDIVSDITAIPASNDSFDAVLCTEVLEHVPEPVAALRELARLVRPGGKLIVTAPFCSITHFAPFHFSTGFSRYFYRHHLPRLGFEIEEISENGNFFEYLAQEIRRLRGTSRKYVEAGELTPFEWAAAEQLLMTLEDRSGRDEGSAELLNFGCHVLARKHEREIMHRAGAD